MKTRFLKSKLMTFLGAAAMLFAAVASASAHTFYTTLTRMDYIQKEKTIEITIEIFTHDVDQILKLAKKNNEKNVDEEKLMFSYLQKNFVVRSGDDKDLALEWVGTESKVDTTYFYLQISNVESFEDFSLQDTIFFESFPEQKNLVIARWSGNKVDLLYKAGDKFQKIAGNNTVTAENKNK